MLRFCLVISEDVLIRWAVPETHVGVEMALPHDTRSKKKNNKANLESKCMAYDYQFPSQESHSYLKHLNDAIWHQRKNKTKQLKTPSTRKHKKDQS